MLNYILKYKPKNANDAFYLFFLICFTTGTIIQIYRSGLTVGKAIMLFILLFFLAFSRQTKK
ncbi:hypothetical protein BAU14_01580 [Enterococcus sp. CU9D]|nr:hypothetical protein BAU14_01580 [Enterococcus sp. CU9D]